MLVQPPKYTSFDSQPDDICEQALLLISKHGTSLAVYFISSVFWMAQLLALCVFKLLCYQEYIMKREYQMPHSPIGNTLGKVT